MTSLIFFLTFPLLKKILISLARTTKSFKLLQLSQIKLGIQPGGFIERCVPR